MLRVYLVASSFNIRPLYYSTWYIFNFGQIFPSSETQQKLNIYHVQWYRGLNSFSANTKNHWLPNIMQDILSKL